MHTGWVTPLTGLPSNFAILVVKRDIIQAAYWADLMTSGALEDYLKTAQGQAFANYWSNAEVRRADEYIKNNPLQGP